MSDLKGISEAWWAHLDSYPPKSPDFPSDEDVEVAAQAIDPWEVFVASDGHNAIRQRDTREIARAALQAVADARRTEEET